MKKKHVIFPAALLLLLALLHESCHKDTNNQVATTDTLYTLTPDTIITPRNFPTPEFPDDNKPSKEIAQLGRMLYYDPILSNDGRSCSSCHIQSTGFTTPALYNNTMAVLPHINLAWSKNFMWDGSKVGSLEDVMMFEVKDFFGTDIAKMNQSTLYRSLVKKYFRTDVITYKELAYSLAQFFRTMVSSNTRYERAMRGEVQLTAEERKGETIFFTEKGDCFHCHVNPVMTDNLLHNTGLDSIYTKNDDKGYFNVTGDPADLGKFKSANLRNVALRSHFMHDGRFSSLEEVIDFYDHGMHKVSNLDPIMTKPAKANGLQLNNFEKSQLIAFLKTLTDSTFITDPKLSNPH